MFWENLFIYFLIVRT